MEGSGYVSEGYFQARTPQFGQEMKKAAGGDHFIVEELLDFSNEEEEEEDGVLEGNSTESSAITAVDSCNSSFSGVEVADVSLSGDLCEPSEELAELEWLSNFVDEDSFSSEELQKLSLISGVKSGPGSGSVTSSSSTRSNDIPSFASKLTIQQPAPYFLPEASTVPGKARSKRSRGTPCNWSSRCKKPLLVLPTSPSSESESILLNPIKKAPKPAKKKERGPALIASCDGRKCLHCATDRTPQWRTGPLGPKTLCNACGVRYKSGRLVPEYRPAASPTFVLSRHSNSHRKVMELRRQKGLQHQHQHQQGIMICGPGVGDVGLAAEGSGDEFLVDSHLGPELRSEREIWG